MSEDTENFVFKMKKDEFSDKNTIVTDECWKQFINDLENKPNINVINKLNHEIEVEMEQSVNINL